MFVRTAWLVLRKDLRVEIRSLEIAYTTLFFAVSCVAIFSFAFFGQGLTNLGWTVISDIAPKAVLGLTAGIFNFSTNLAGIITPIVIGVLFARTGSFVGPLAYIAVVALIGAFSYSVVLGDIHRLELDDVQPARVPAERR